MDNRGDSAVELTLTGARGDGKALVLGRVSKREGGLQEGQSLNIDM